MAGDTKVFVDTDILLYADDVAFPDKLERARAWLGVLWQRRNGRLSTQVLGDYYQRATQALHPPMKQGDARAEVRRYQHWRPWSLDHQTVETAWALEARFGLAWPDATIVAAALHQGCALLLSEALPHDLRIDSVRVLNPFLVEPSVLDRPLESSAT